MSLLNPANPVDIFIECGRRFIAAPNPASGIEFDDAVVALKRHARVQLGDEALASSLEPFARLIRDQAVERLMPLFDEVVARLGR